MVLSPKSHENMAVMLLFLLKILGSFVVWIWTLELLTINVLQSSWL